MILLSSPYTTICYTFSHQGRPRCCKKHALRGVQQWRRAGSDAYGHRAALHKPRVSCGTAVGWAGSDPYEHPAALQKTIRFVRYGSGVGGSNPYEHPAALQKTGVSRSTAVALGGVQPLWACRGLQKSAVSRSTAMTARTSAGGVRPFKAYGHLGALQKPRISRSTAVAAGGVRPLWTHRGTAKTTRCARYGGGGGQDPTLNQLWAARGAAKTTRSVQHGGGSRRGPTLMDTPRDCKNLTFRAAQRWQQAGSDSDGHPWEP